MNVKTFTGVFWLGEEETSRLPCESALVRQILQVLGENVSRVEDRRNIQKWNHTSLFLICTKGVVFILL